MSEEKEKRWKDKVNPPFVTHTGGLVGGAKPKPNPKQK